MKLIEFLDKFPDEASCKAAFKLTREKAGVVCQRCDHTEHYWLSTRDQYKCKRCDSRQSLRSGTLLNHSNLSYQYWFIAMHLLTSTKKGFSSKELQRQLGHKRYEPIWYMAQKIRSVMGQRECKYQLMGDVESDEAFFEIAYPIELPVKRGKGSEAKQAVLVMASSKEVKKKVQTKTGKEKYRINKACKYFKMRVINDLKIQTIEKELLKSIHPKSTLITDGANVYLNMIAEFKDHKRQLVEPKESSNTLPWVNIAIANAKRKLLDLHHCISKKYLQGYLDEFCYKINPRYLFDRTFDRLLDIAASAIYKPLVLN